MVALVEYNRVMEWRIPPCYSSTFVLAGACCIGWVLHRTLVRGALSVTSPLSIGVLLGGTILVLLGYQLEQRFDPSEFVPGREQEDDRRFDESRSPLREEWLEDHERDSSRE